MTQPSRRAVLGAGLGLAGAGLVGCARQDASPRETTLGPVAGRVLVLLAADAPHPPGTRSLGDALRKRLPDADVVPMKTVDEQASHLRSAGERGFGIVLVQAAAPHGIGPAAEVAEKAGVIVVTVDRVPMDLDGVQAHVGWDEFSVGEREVPAVARATAGLHRLRHAELVPEGPDNQNARARFEGNAFTLSGLTADGVMSVKSGQSSYDGQAVNWDRRSAMIRRLTTTYAVTYPRDELDAVIVPSSAWVPLVAEIAREAGHLPPRLLSGDLAAEDIASLRRGELFSGLYRDPDALAAEAVRMVEHLRAGRAIPFRPLFSLRNRLGKRPAFLVLPVLVTRANMAKALGRNPVLNRAARP